MPSPIDFTLGALEIGTLISTLLYGVMNIQAYTYYTADIQGCSRIRAFATIVWILETLHAAISWAYMYSATVTYYGQPAHLTSVPWSLSATVVIGGTVATLVQAFFTYRLWRLSRSLYLAIVGWVLAMIHLGAILAVGILASEIKQLGVFAERYLWVALLAIADSLVLDIFNTVGLCYYLNKQQTMFTRMSLLLDKIAAWTIGSFYFLPAWHAVRSRFQRPACSRGMF
ncbi:hypothetical protein PUNSTDRAFT_67859 [Punctularia strigosozonata HHB-11173 SS5]|uniref:uncharacterized protein n=1 Tax=Punctularia strigosozonata (strain HHB-11173) TaxID=741275 RepID=UPI0004417CA7|nr:uncharacterized protein PUNSTDRAFT_67859 [Punctularia strigosozonata HHB-11173 SS5]EIN08890.1 hypothetical protein PUNSTDRAFT_67859 [Punctularia strigosozonata HHB-11173 SS5]